MAFNTHVDHFGLIAASGETPAIELRTSPSQVSPGVVAEAEDDFGDVIVTDTNGDREKLTANYLVKKACACATTFILGKLTALKLLTGVTITTEKGKYPEIAAEGETMPTGQTQGATITLPAFSIEALNKAQILFSAFTLSGTGVKLNTCSAKISCNPGLCENAGVIVAHNVSRGMIEVTATYVQSGATAPTFAASEGWTVTAGPSKEDPEGGHDMWSVTLTKPLATVQAA